jgi:hypothetical protein
MKKSFIYNQLTGIQPGVRSTAMGAIPIKINEEILQHDKNTTKDLADLLDNLVILINEFDVILNSKHFILDGIKFDFRIYARLYPQYKDWAKNPYINQLIIKINKEKDYTKYNELKSILAGANSHAGDAVSLINNLINAGIYDLNEGIINNDKQDTKTKHSEDIKMQITRITEWFSIFRSFNAFEEFIELAKLFEMIKNAQISFKDIKRQILYSLNKQGKRGAVIIHATTNQWLICRDKNKYQEDEDMAKTEYESKELELKPIKERFAKIRTNFTQSKSFDSFLAQTKEQNDSLSNIIKNLHDVEIENLKKNYNEWKNNESDKSISTILKEIYKISEYCLDMNNLKMEVGALKAKYNSILKAKDEWQRLTHWSIFITKGGIRHVYMIPKEYVYNAVQILSNAALVPTNSDNYASVFHSLTYSGLVSVLADNDYSRLATDHGKLKAKPKKEEQQERPLKIKDLTERTVKAIEKLSNDNHTIIPKIYKTLKELKPTIDLIKFYNNVNKLSYSREDVSLDKSSITKLESLPNILIFKLKHYNIKNNQADKRLHFELYEDLFTNKESDQMSNIRLKQNITLLYREQDINSNNQRRKHGSYHIGLQLAVHASTNIMLDEHKAELAAFDTCTYIKNDKRSLVQILETNSKISKRLNISKDQNTPIYIYSIDRGENEHNAIAIIKYHNSKAELIKTIVLDDYILWIPKFVQSTEELELYDDKMIEFKNDPNNQELMPDVWIYKLSTSPRHNIDLALYTQELKKMLDMLEPTEEINFMNLLRLESEQEAITGLENYFSKKDSDGSYSTQRWGYLFKDIGRQITIFNRLLTKNFIVEYVESTKPSYKLNRGGFAVTFEYRLKRLHDILWESISIENMKQELDKLSEYDLLRHKQALSANTVGIISALMYNYPGIIVLENQFKKYITNVETDRQLQLRQKRGRLTVNTFEDQLFNKMAMFNIEDESGKLFQIAPTLDSSNILERCNLEYKTLFGSDVQYLEDTPEDEKLILQLGSIIEVPNFNTSNRCPYCDIGKGKKHFNNDCNHCRSKYRFDTGNLVRTLTVDVPERGIFSEQLDKITSVDTLAAVNIGELGVRWLEALR